MLITLQSASLYRSLYKYFVWNGVVFEEANRNPLYYELGSFNCHSTACLVQLFRSAACSTFMWYWKYGVWFSKFLFRGCFYDLNLVTQIVGLRSTARGKHARCAPCQLVQSLPVPCTTIVGHRIDEPLLIYTTAFPICDVTKHYSSYDVPVEAHIFCHRRYIAIYFMSPTRRGHWFFAGINKIIDGIVNGRAHWRGSRSWLCF